MIAVSHPKRAIMVGVDFTPSASNALVRARHIAGRSGATLEVVHTRALRDGAKRLRFDLVVVGGRLRPLRDGILGSTGEQIARRIPAPVLIVRRPAAEPHERVMVAVDRTSDVRKMLETSRLVAPDAEVEFLHVYEATYEIDLMLSGASQAALIRCRRDALHEAREMILGRLSKAGVDGHRVLLRRGPTIPLLEEEAHRGETHLIVLDPAHSWLRRFLVGSASRAVIAHGTSDVLLV